jgi:hypothetical protein
MHDRRPSSRLAVASSCRFTYDVIEPISPTTSNTTSAPSSTSNPAKPSITGLIKQAVKAPPQDELVEPVGAEGAIESVGPDGGERRV